MMCYKISGGGRLCGKVRINGAKNSALPIIAASLLAKGKSILSGIPVLEDINAMCELADSLGAECTGPDENGTVEINVGCDLEIEVPYQLANRMRASFLMLGPLLARTGHARICLPGGCAIGTRPVDLHIKGFTAMGADIGLGHGFVEASAPNGLQGCRIYLDFPSVGATENLLMAAVLAKGTTIIENAACEPEITDLVIYLKSMGALIEGAGTATIKIEGVEKLIPCRHKVIPDRIEAGTYMTAVAAAGGSVLIENVHPDHLKPVSAKLIEAGVEISEELDGIRVSSDRRLKAVDVKTHPYPGFPTDMQAQIMSVLTVANGTSMIVENVFENRFLHVCELKRMGANIKIEGRGAIVEGISKLCGARVAATDLRAGAALVIAALCAEGMTEISGVEHVKRGYELFDVKLGSIGADIEYIEQ